MSVSYPHTRPLNLELIHLEEVQYDAEYMHFFKLTIFKKFNDN